MLRTFRGAVSRVGVPGNGIQEPFSSSSGSASPPSKAARRPHSQNCLSLSSPINFQSHNPVSGLPSRCPSLEVDGFHWVSEDSFEDDGFHGFSAPYVLGKVPYEEEFDKDSFEYEGFHRFPVACVSADVPSEEEVDNSVSAIQEVFSSTSHESEMDWKEPSLNPYDTRMQLSNGSDRVYYTFHLLQTDPTIQKMVKSISCDEAIWDALLKNEIVRELRESFSSGSSDSQSSDGTSSRSESNSKTNVVLRIFGSARAKFMDVIEKIMKIATDLFQHKINDETNLFPDPFTEKLRTSFMLSIIVLLVVMVSRASRA